MGDRAACGAVTVASTGMSGLDVKEVGDLTL